MSPQQREYRRMVRAFFRPAYARPFWLLVAVVMLLVGARMALTPWMAGQVRAELEQQPGMHAHFGDLALFSFPPSAIFLDVAVADREGRTVVAMPRLEVHTTWREIMRAVAAHGHPAPPPLVRMRLKQPDLFVRTMDPARTVDELHGWLASALPVRTEVVAVDRGRVVVVAPDHAPAVCTRDVDVAVDQSNMFARFALMAGAPACRALARSLPPLAALEPGESR
jgi:hypothetical protein